MGYASARENSRNLLHFNGAIDRKALGWAKWPVMLLARLSAISGEEMQAGWSNWKHDNELSRSIFFTIISGRKSAGKSKTS